MYVECDACGDQLGSVGFECADCGGVHCREHRSDPPGCGDPEYETITPDQSPDPEEVGAADLVERLDGVRSCSTCGRDLDSTAHGCEGCEEVYCEEHVLDHDSCRAGDDLLVKFDPDDPDDAALFEAEVTRKTDVLIRVGSSVILIAMWLVALPRMFPELPMPLLIVMAVLTGLLPLRKWR